MLSEEEIHIAVRNMLSGKGWQLLAGEYPGGSDNTLKRFYIKDYSVAKDNSPYPRRHSLGVLKLDLIAKKGGVLYLIEMKPQYSYLDEKKLIKILSERVKDLNRALEEQLGIDIAKLKKCIPVLGFSANSKFKRKDGFTYLLVKDIETVVIEECG